MTDATTRPRRIRRLALALIILGGSVQAAHGQALQTVPASPQTWQVLQSSGGVATAADGQVGSPVTVRFDLLAQAAAAGGTLELPLTNGVSVRAAIAWRQVDATQTFVAGPLLDGQQGEASLTAVADTLVGRITVGGRLFVVRRAPGSAAHIVIEVDPRSLPPDAQPLISPDSGSDRQQAVAGATAGDDGSIVDLLILYTPAARIAAGDTSTIVAELTGAVNNGNLALANAGVAARFRLAHYEEVSYSETGNDMNTDLNRLTNFSDGYLDSVHALRDQYHADVVTLLTVDSDACGQAWLQGPSATVSSFQARAFNVVLWSCANGNLSLAHEIGHNMGLHHDRKNASGTPAFPYAYGYRIPGSRSVMAYACTLPTTSPETFSCEPRRAIYSTPLFRFPGTSSPAGVVDSDDNARALKSTMSIVANFRDSTCTYAVTPTSVSVGQNSSSGTVTVTTGSGCAWSAISSSTSFLTLSGGGVTQTGSGSLTYTVASNRGGARTGTLTVAGQTVAVQQSEYVEPPAIVVHPKSQAVNLGATVDFAVVATGGGVLKYDWRKNGTSLFGVTTSSTMELGSVRSSDAGTYTVIVSNTVGSVTSNGAVLSINVPPAITAHPQSQTVNPGVDVTFTVAATGTAPLTYVWRKNGTAFTATSTPTVTLFSVKSTDAGTYDVVVQNVAGNATSNSATLQVNDPVRITGQPANQSAAAGATVSFTVTATGTAPITYEWRKNGTAVSGATGATVTLTNVGAADAGIYTAIVTNIVGSVKSNQAVLALPGTYAFSTLAGLAGSAGRTDGTGGDARFNYPNSVAVDGAGNLYVAETGQSIRTITPAGVVTSVSGSGTWLSHYGVTIDSAGTLYLTDTDHTVHSVTAAGVATTIAGKSTVTGSADGVGSAARFYDPWGIVRDSSGNLFVADSFNETIRKITTTGAVSTLAGQADPRVPELVDGTGPAARFAGPRSLAIDSAGNIYVAEASAIRKIVPSTAVVTTLAGRGLGYPGPVDGTGVAARFNTLFGVAVDATGTLFVPDAGLIRKVASTGAVTTIGGDIGLANTAAGVGSQDGPGNVARFGEAHGIAVDASGNLYIADTYNHTIRKGLLIAAPTITTHPASTTVKVGDRITLSVVAAGTPALLYQWQLSEDGASWTDVGNAPFASERYSGGTTATVSIGIHDVLMNQLQFRCVVTNTAGWVDTHAATLTVNAAPTFTALPANQTIKAGDNATFTVTVIGNPAPTYQWQVSTTSGSPWTNLANDALYAGVTTTTLTLTAAPAALSGNQYRVVATNTLGTLASTAATLTVNAALAITTQPADRTVTAGQSAQFTAAASGTSSPSYQWQASTNGGSAWTDLPDGTPYSGVATATLTIAAASAGLNGRRYRLVVTDGASSATSNAVTLTVYGAASANPGSLRFVGTQVIRAIGLDFAVTGAQTLTVTFAGAASAWTATSSQPWLELTAATGTAAASFTAAVVNPRGVIGSGAATLTATITVTAPTAPNSPVTIPVTLTVVPAGGGIVPFGSFDTPTDGSTVAGAIAVTGWALDDVGVFRIEVFRNCVDAIDRSRGACVSPSGTGLPASYAFLGYAFLLAGARPDVEARFSAFPLAYRAGWGFMLLTNALPHQTKGTTEGGQGSYVLSAFAIDEELHASLLGTKTIAVDNDHATVPFGAIDTPAQGGTIPEVSAPYNNVNAYPAFGWAMTQASKCIDTTSTAAYRVFIDGVQRPITAGTDWFAGLNRPDLAAAYPGLCNSTNALAVYYINAGALGLTSGLHTISWDVTDSAGQLSAGIGSRFFNVVATSGDPAVMSDAPTVRRTPDTTEIRSTADPVAPGLSRTPARSSPENASVENASVVSGFSRPVAVRIGGADAPAESVAPDAAGHRDVRLPIGRRLQLGLGGPVDAGYQQTGDDVRALPVGSTLDAAAGTFAWEPPAGFFGPFDLIFTAGPERLGVTVTIVDGTRAPAPIAMQIDEPRDGATMTGALTVAGWALDPQSTSGSGIDAVHVWTLRRDVAAASPQFLGAATLGLARSDVAQAFGAPFYAAGFQFSAASLAPGDYDVTVHVWSVRTGQWENAQVVRVSVR